MEKRIPMRQGVDFSSFDNGGLQPMYRMPTAFGPATGPRNVPREKQRHRYVNKRTQLTVDALTDAGAIAPFLPPRCSLAGSAIVRVSLSTLKRVGWLAGRGYNIVTVQFPEVEFHGDHEMIVGDFNAVLWESLCDPIITGREEIAFPKLFAEIPDLQFLGRGCSGSASWLGYQFFNIEAEELMVDVNSEIISNRPVLCYKYVPRTGDWGQADVEYMTASTPDPHQPTTETHLFQTGSGEFAFHRARWEDLPTLYPIVNALAELPIRQFIGANLRITSQGEVETVGGGNFSGQRQVP
jgi:hypothetical protein